MAVSWKWVRSQVRLRPCLSFITGTSSRLVPTLTQEAASSSHSQNNHWQCKVAGSQVRWGIEATAIKSTWLQWFPPHFHSLILWIHVAKQISTRKVNVTKRPAFALFLADLRESYGNPACSDTMEPKKPADWVVWAGKRKHSSTQRGCLGGALDIK